MPVQGSQHRIEKCTAQPSADHEFMKEQHRMQLRMRAPSQLTLRNGVMIAQLDSG